MWEEQRINRSRIHTVAKMHIVNHSNITLKFESENDMMKMGDEAKNHTISRYLTERKKAAKMYFDVNNPEDRQACVDLFERINDELINFLGL